ncbi:MAG: preprotein translocase subunit SecG [Alphaproteobacteria bacterium]|nr:preprotein translocase subunit SecG [Alphaproteobacteria bacterium]
MVTVIVVIHVLLAISIVLTVLLQRSEGGGLGIGGGGGFMTTRGTANLLTRATGVLAGLFFLTSLVLVILTPGTGRRQPSILDQAPASTTAPFQAPAEPSVPLGR